MFHFSYMGPEFILFKLFCLIFFLGVILFVVWAMRTLNKKDLKKWVIGLLIVGLLGMTGSSLLMGKWKNSSDWKGIKTDKSEECGGVKGFYFPPEV